jgi:uncharacterized membrane protein
LEEQSRKLNNTINYNIIHAIFYSRPVAEILGIAGLLPIYPKIYMNAWRRRMQQQQLEEETKNKSEEAVASA